jgi:hypothetical protein
MNELTWREARDNWEELFYAEDPYASYDFDDIVLFKSKDTRPKYALFFDSGCSCPSPFEDNPNGDVYTKTQLLNVVNNWNGSSTEKVMKEWILENIK